MNEELLIRWAWGLGVTFGIWLVGWIVGRIAVHQLMRLLHRTPTDVDDMILAAARPVIPIWSALLGIAIGAHQAPLSDEVHKVVSKGVEALLILSLTFALSRFLAELVRVKSARLTEGLPASTLTQNMIHLVVIGLGLLVVAGQLGIAITPLLTALGVGSLAVALALQPTLSNLFAGMQIAIARKIRVGDFVELETGTQGFVQDIGWRSTQIRELPNNLILVPNARLAEMLVKNFSLPEGEQSALVQVGVSYGSDLELVERVTIEVATETLRDVQGGVPTFQPFIRMHTFGDSSINFSVILRVREFVDRYLVTHEFIKRLQRRYAETGIEIPFPQRVMHFPKGLPGSMAAEASAASTPSGRGQAEAGR